MILARIPRCRCAVLLAAIPFGTAGGVELAVPGPGSAPSDPFVGGKAGDRARWLEPYGGDAAWRAEMWGQIVALHGRYPHILAYLKDEWWADEAHIETLCALAVWRSELDDGGVDPREELAFHAQLTDYSQALRQEGGGVSKAWKPGAPPQGWAGE